MNEPTRRMLELLGAEGPQVKFEEQLNLYGRFVGSWDLENRYYAPSDGLWRTESGEWHFGWILDGYAIQDVIIMPALADKAKPGFPEGGRGTTVRWYDPRLDAWRVVFFGPAELQFAVLVGHRLGEDIVQEGMAEGGFRLRWVFSEITTERFRSQGYRSDDDGTTWRLVQEMQARLRTA